jgi:hypothetical protein
MGWLDKLQAAGAKATEQAKPAVTAPATPPAEIHQVTVGVRNSNPLTGDPGEAAIGYFIFEGGKLTMIDEKGAALGAPIAVKPDVDPRTIARGETWKRWQENARFGRRLEYPPIGIA